MSHTELGPCYRAARYPTPLPECARWKSRLVYGALIAAFLAIIACALVAGWKWYEVAK